MLQLVLAFVSRLQPGCILVATAFACACELDAAQFTLRWADNSSNESGFQIERATGSAGAFSLVATTGANVTSYVDTGLADATFYRYRVRAYNSAGFSAYSNIASGTTPAAAAPAPNTAPTITAIANRTAQSGTSSGTIAFTVGDAQTAAGSLVVTATSSNTTILPDSRLTLGGSGAARTLTFTPVSGTSGTSTVTLRVSDGSLSASTSFVVTVITAASAPAPNTAPTISAIAPQTIAMNGTSSALAFSIGDAQTSANNLALSVTSSNTGLVPLSGITLGGSGANRTVTVRPAANATGSSTLTIIVSDGSLTASTTFVTTVVSSAFASGDVGSPAISGSTTTSGTTTQIRAGGTDIWNTSDQFHFSRQSITGDAELKVRLTGLTQSDPWAKAGLMFRASTQANAAYAFVFLTPNNGVALQSRSATGGRSGQQSAAPATIPNWLRLTRSGNTVHAACSTDGNTWTQLGSVVVDLPTTALAGLAVTSHAATVATTATFQNLTTTLAPAAPQPAPAPAPTPVNTAPTITAIAGQTIAMNGASPAIAFAIGDAQTSASGLTLSAASSNTALVPVGNITFGGSGANRTLTIRPVANATGSSTITVTVSDGSLTTSRSFAVTVAASLVSGDIGSPAIAGSLSANGTTFQVRAGGADIWGTYDQFHFARQSLAGDRELTVRVAGLTNTNAWAKAGLMFRSSTAANAAFIHLFITPSNGVVLQYRTANGANASQQYRESATVPRWLKLTRVGNTFYAFHSANGTTWTLLDFVTVNLPDTALAGLAVTSHNVSAATTATFENFKID